MSSYQTPLDRGYYTEFVTAEPSPGSNLSKPIVSVKELGITVVEKDPRTGANILQNVQAAIRSGVSSIQLVMTTPSNNPIGGRPKAYGKEVREAIREQARASGLFIGGIEMPTSSNTNMSGFDGRQGFDEHKRHEDMEEVRDAIKFTADIAEGGGVDIFSQEFPRTIFDAQWNRKGRWADQFWSHPEEPSHAVKHLVDSRTGRIVDSVRMGDTITYPVWNVAEKDSVYIDPKTGEQIDVKEGQWIEYDGRPIYNAENRVPKFDAKEERFMLTEKSFKDFEEEAQILTEERRKKFASEGKQFTQEDIITPEEAVFKAQAEGKAAEMRGHAGSSARAVDDLMRRLKRLEEARHIYRKLEEAASGEEKERLKTKARDDLQGLGLYVPPEAEKLPTEIIDDQIFDTKKHLQSAQESSTGYLRQALEARKRAEEVISAEKFAKKKTFESYAEMGIAAMQETETNPHAKRDLYVGPELGWPDQWGGHPEEFIELVKNSREEMKTKLTDPNGEWRMNAKEADERAKRHIKGLFDTAHMGMWLRNFKRDGDESEDEHQKRFKQWYLEMVDKLISENVVGSIQAVDSASGAHGHLPPGQGIFPVVEAVERFKKKGFNGFIVSEGHEEEQFGHQRILLETWNAFGSPIGRIPYTTGPTAWRDIQRGYFGRTYVPTFMVGEYAPSNEFKLWSEIPLE